MAAQILVTGATGLLGRLLVKALVYNKFEVRACIHSPEKTEYVKATGVETVPFDFSDNLSIDAAIDGIKQVFLITPPVREQVEFTRKFVDRSLLRGRIENIVRLSALGADQYSISRIARWHRESEKYIEASGIPYTFIRPNIYMQEFVRTIQPAGGFLYLPFGEGRVSFVDVRDVAHFSAEILRGSKEYFGRTYTLTGGMAYSIDDVAHTITQVVHHHLGYIAIPDETAVHILESVGIPGWYAEAIVGFYSQGRTGDLNLISNNFNEVMGRAPASFEKFVRDYGEIFRVIVQQEHHIHLS